MRSMRDTLAGGKPALHNQMVAVESDKPGRTQERHIIDEEETARDLYGHWFFTHGFEVMCAVGIRGLSFALRRECPQLIVTELRARDLTLNQLTARLRCQQQTRCIPIIVVTSSSDPQPFNHAKEAEAADVIA